jgi:hypothetical protein
MHLVKLDRDVAGAEHADLVAQANEHHRRGKALAVAGRGPGRGVAAVGAAGDAHPVAVHQTDLDQVVHAVHEVVELFRRGPAVVELRERDAAAGAGAIVRVKDRVALRRGDLRRDGIKSVPAVRVVRLGAAVHRQDQRHAFPVGARQRMNQQALDLQAVTRPVAHDFLVRQLDVAQPGIGIGQPLRTTAAADLEQLARMRGRAGAEADRATIHGYAERIPDRPAGRRQRALVAPVQADLAEARLHALVADVDEPLGIAPGEVPHVALEPGQQVARLAAARAHHGQAALARVIGIGGHDQAEVTAVGGPRHPAELARGLDDAERAPVRRSDEDHACLHHHVVHQFARTDLDGQPIASRAPCRLLRGALERQVHRVGTAPRGHDTQQEWPGLLLDDALGKAMLAGGLELFAVLVRCNERQALAIRCKAVILQVGVEREQRARFATGHVNDVQAAGLVATALGEKGHAPVVGRPAELLDIHRPRHKAPALALRIDDVQLAPGRAVVLLEQLARHDARVGDVAPVGTRGHFTDHLELMDLPEGHARGERGHGQQQGERGQPAAGSGIQFRHGFLYRAIDRGSGRGASASGAPSSGRSSVSGVSPSRAAVSGSGWGPSAGSNSGSGSGDSS